MNEAAQLQFRLKTPRARFDESHVEEMIRRLKAGATEQNRGWLKSSDLGAVTWSEKRDLRIIKGLSKGRIVGYPGSPGYKPAEDCTLEELRHFRRASVSQCRVILANVRQTERFAHAAIAK